jgi:hypothetical protein
MGIITLLQIGQGVGLAAAPDLTTHRIQQTAVTLLAC